MRILTAALGAAAFALLATGPAAASMPQRHLAGDVEFSYSAPEISEEGDHVTWSWEVRNSGNHDAKKVVMTHRLTPVLPITYVSDPCEAAGDTIKCKWETLAAGEAVQGVIEADLPENLSGSVGIKGRIVWQQTVQPSTAVEATKPTVAYTSVG
jgi:hypothetical protein